MLAQESLQRMLAELQLLGEDKGNVGLAEFILSVTCGRERASEIESAHLYASVVLG